MKNIFSLAIFLAISSCSLIPDYKNQSAQNTPILSQDLINVEELNLDENQEKEALNIGWKKFFKNKELQEIIQITLDNNKDLKIAALNIKSLQELYNIQRADLFPQISADASFSRQSITKNSNNFGISGRKIIQQQYRVGLSASYELDLFQRISSLKKSALQDFLAQKETQNALKISLISQVANTYLQLVSDNKKLEIKTELVQISQKIYDLQEQKYKQGSISKITLSQAQANLQQAKSEESAMKSLVDQDKNQLVFLMNEKDDSRIKIVTSKSLKIAHQDLKNLSSEILLLRPDIMAAEHQLLSANANIGAARAAFFPSISITSFYGFASAKSSTLFDSGSRGAWNFTPQISIPIFEAGKNISSLKISEIDKNIALEKYQQAIQAAFKETSDELVIRKNISTQLEAQKSLTRANQETLKLTKIMHEQGSSGLSEELQAKQNLLIAQEAETEVRQKYYTNMINLYKTLGGGINEGSSEDSNKKQNEEPKKKPKIQKTQVNLKNTTRSS